MQTLVMTHDLKTFYDINKVFEEIVDTCKLKGKSIQKFWKPFIDMPRDKQIIMNLLLEI
jgi:hypothetical protein